MCLKMSRCWSHVFLVLIFSLGCSQAEFSKTTPHNLKTTTCDTNDVRSTTRLTKVIFVVDTSGSNALWTLNQGTQNCPVGVFTCTPPTDPTKSFRGGAIQNFFNEYQNKTNFNWGLITFSGVQTQSLTTIGGVPAITSSASAFQQAIQSFYTIKDYDATPYQGALKMATTMIQNDADLNADSQPQYFVIFLTDGFPTDYVDQNGAFEGVALQDDLLAMLAVAPGRVSLSTVYYGQVDDPNSITLLQGMAQNGAGRFARAADTTTTIKIDDLIPGHSSTCH